MKTINVIAIDGPAGAGKSTIAKKVALKLNWQYIDTGAMYRAVTLKAICLNSDFSEESVFKISKNFDIKLDKGKVFLDGKDVSEEIRTPQITEKISLVAGMPKVREVLVALQRKLGELKPSVMEGRDIGSVVFPDAKYKFYLDASVEERAKRRFEEYKIKNISVDIEEIKKAIIDRDNKDFTRKVGPLKKLSDAICIDTSDMSIDEVVMEIQKNIKKT